MIGRQFLFTGLFMMIFGGLLALLVRWQLAWPEQPVPGFSWVPEPYMYDGIIPPEFYNSLFTMHATIMIFFVVMPILVGCFGNFLIPLMIGDARHGVPGAQHAVVLDRRGRRGDHAVELLRPRRRSRRRAGRRTRRCRRKPPYTGVGLGQNLWIIALIVLGVSSLMGSINYITTIINMRAPGHDSSSACR